MKQEYKHIDELLKDSLEGYSRPPSPALWERISLVLLFRRNWIYLSAFLLVLTVGMLYLLPSATETGPDSDTGSLNETPDLQVTENLKEGITLLTANSLSAEESESTVPGIPGVIPAEPIKPTEEPSARTIPSEVPETFPEHQAGPVSGEDHFSLYPGLERMISKQGGENPGYMPALAGPTACPLQIMARRLYGIPEPAADYGFSRSNALLLQISPELIFNGNNNGDLMHALNIDLSYLLEGRDGFVQAGAGIGISEDKGVFDVEYTQFDSIGFYERVTSFMLDPVSGKPLFNTTTEGIFDTVDYSHQGVSKNLYYYLRIPFTAGIRFFEAKRTSLYLSAGGTYLVLLKKHEPGYNYTNDQAAKIAITNNTPGRIKTNLQLSAGTVLKYRLASRFDLRLDASYNYYWNALMERQYDQRSPWSVSLKGGIIFKL